MKNENASRPTRQAESPFWRRLLFRIWVTVRWIGAIPVRLFKPAVNSNLSKKKRFFHAGAGLFCGVSMLLLLYTLILYPFTPRITHLRQMKVQQPSVVFSADGEELTRFRHGNRQWVLLDDISPHVVEALIATEDHRFYDHHGVDFIRLASSIGHTLIGDIQGGSTITMQLARNLYPHKIGRNTSISRKIKEIITAFKIEYAYEKDEILETYLNTVPFLYNTHGVEMAARTYFRKSASDLDIIESATLVGMLKATSYYNPVRNPERSQQRRNIVLDQMAKHDALSVDQLETYKQRPTHTRFERQTIQPIRAPHFVQYIRLWLSEWSKKKGYDLYTDGLVIRTTLNHQLQQLAEEAVVRQGQALQDVANVEWAREGNEIYAASPQEYHSLSRRNRAFAYFWEQNNELAERFIQATSRYRNGLAADTDPAELLSALRSDTAFMDSLKTAKTRLEVGFVALDPRNGHVKAWVGSRNYTLDQYDHVSQARRQPGSTFKPFVYAAALEMGYSPEDKLADVAVEIEVGRDQIWRPVNAGSITGEEYTLRNALAYSKNTITAQLIDDVGPKRTARIARKMGINQSPLDAVPSLALGTSEVTLLEMVAAYATIANDGRYHEPVVITRIEDGAGNILFESEPDDYRAFSENSAHTLVDMMRGVVDYGTGQRIRNVFGVRCDVAGKTGTTQDNADGWFLLMHPHLVAGSWMGFNDPRVTFRSDYWGQGAHNALYVVGDFYRYALRQGRIDPRPRFADVPVVEPKRSFFDRVGSWFNDTADSWGKGSRDDDSDSETPDRPERPIQERLPDRAPTRRVDLRPSPAPEPESRFYQDEDIEALARDLGRLIREIDRLVEEQDDEVTDLYYEHVEPYIRQAERFFQAPQNRSNINRSQTAGDYENSRLLDDVAGHLLDRYVSELNSDQRADLDRILREVQRELHRR